MSNCAEHENGNARDEEVEEYRRYLKVFGIGLKWGYITGAAFILGVLVGVFLF